MSAFEINILGASGGPLDGGNQGILLSKAGSDALKKYICIDAGSGLRQITSMLIKNAKMKNARQEFLCQDDMTESLFENLEEPVGCFVDKSSSIMRGLGPSATPQDGESVMTLALRIFNKVEECYITHPHLDHVAALAINTPACNSNGKSIWGLRPTVEALKKHIFNDVIWPNLLEEPRMKLRVNSLDEAQRHRVSCIPNWFITPLRLMHGVTVHGSNPCPSTAYLVEDDATKDAILVFGDLESDLISRRRFVSNIWRHLSKTVAFEKLKAIVIECSCPNATKDEHLFGHLSPKYLVHELKSLSKVYGRPLDGLHVIIVHVKMASGGRDPRLVILDEVRQLAAAEGLGKIVISIAIEGYTFVV